MKEKLELALFGFLISFSLISPPAFLRLSFIEFSDFLIFLFFLYLFFDWLRRQSKNKYKNFLKLNHWILLVLLLILSMLIYGLNLLILRFVFYFLTGYFFTEYLYDKSSNLFQYFLFPFAIVTFLNILSVIFELSFVDNSIGWISYYYENPSFINRGRLSGFQGSGPNVAGGIFSILVFLNLYVYKTSNKLYFLLISLLNLFLVFVTYSRGSYLSIFVAFIAFLYITKNLKVLIYSVIGVLFVMPTYLYFGDSKILLKESDRGFLTQIAIQNIKPFKGLGPGNYVNTIYKDYFLSINPKILEENLNINLNKVELGITPEEFRDQGIDFFIGTSGGGFEILVQSKLISECSEDRITCQHVRVKKELLENFLSTLLNYDHQNISKLVIESNCLDIENTNILRAEFYCFIDSLYENYEINDYLNKIPKELFFIPCEDSGTYKCSSRELAIGELAVIVEQLSLRNEIIPLNNFRSLCLDCDFRNIKGYIRFNFDKIDGILPRSVFTFYTSSDGENWEMVGYPRTTGNLVEFVNNNSFLELGGHSDGQSFGNTFLEAHIAEVTLTDKNGTKNMTLTKENLNNEYFVYKPNSTDIYTSNITFTEAGIKLFRPNKYWVALENQYYFNDDFEIILKINFPEIPWERQTLISNTSILNNQTQSWKLEVDDGRLFFYWSNFEGVFLDSNVIGDKSLRSGVLIQKNGFLSNTSAPIVDPSYLSQLTTAHNGYLTFAVEFGLIISIIFYSIFIYFLIKCINKVNNQNVFIFIPVLIFFVQNFTNDMIYSPDMVVMLLVCLSFLDYSTKSFDFKKS